MSTIATAGFLNSSGRIGRRKGRRAGATGNKALEHRASAWAVLASHRRVSRPQDVGSTEKTYRTGQWRAVRHVGGAMARRQAMIVGGRRGACPHRDWGPVQHPPLLHQHFGEITVLSRHGSQNVPHARPVLDVISSPLLNHCSLADGTRRPYGSKSTW